MIEFKNQCKEPPYVKFKKEYDKAVIANQIIVEAISVSSMSKSEKMVDSRFVNLKIVDNKDFIFFSNYESPKSKQFKSHDQVAINIFWNVTNVQVRMRAIIKKTTRDFNQNYFSGRAPKKNALAISSEQSKKIDSYKNVEKKYMKSFKNQDLTKCPEYWGGFVFRPYYFEFWEGHHARLNKRTVLELKNGDWEEYFLQP